MRLRRKKEIRERKQGAIGGGGGEELARLPTGLRKLDRFFSSFDPPPSPFSLSPLTNPPLQSKLPQPTLSFQERADGKNVGGWHWQERDVLPWAQQRLQELLGGAEVVSSSSSASSTSTSSSFETGPKVETSGEAVVNSRKGKLIPAYELTLKGTWREAGKGEKSENNNNNNNKGDWEIYLADENQGEDPDVRTSVAPGAGEGAEEAARAFREAAKVGLVPRLRDFVKELAAGGGGGGGGGGWGVGSDGAEAGNGKAAPAAAAAAAAKSEPAAAAKGAAPAAPAAAAAAPKPAAAAAATAAAPSSTTSSSKDAATSTLKLTEKFYCRPSDLFEALTDPRKVMAFTQAPAEIEGPPFKAGNRYSLFAGAVEASFAEGTDAGAHRIELDWRFKEVSCLFFLRERKKERKSARERSGEKRKERALTFPSLPSPNHHTKQKNKNSGPTPPCPASPSACASPPRGSPS